MSLTPEQDRAAQAIVRAALHHTSHVFVSAMPGSGKSHLLRSVAHRLPPHTRAAYVAFNRHNVTALDGRLPAHVPARTFHALGEGLARRHLSASGHPFTHDDTKATTLYTQALLQAAPGLSRGQISEAARHLRALHQALSSRLLPPTPEHIRTVLKLGVSPLPEGPRLAFQQARGVDLTNLDVLARVLKWGRRHADQLADQGTFDYNDRLLYPLRHRLGVGRFELLLVDEAQDLSAAQQAFCRQLARRLALVGDPHQSIFQFSGADPGGLQAFADRLAPDLVTCPLTLSFRLPQAHARFARAWTPQLRALDSAEEGTITHVDEASLEDLLIPGDLVVCRTNAPLITLAFRLRRVGRPVRVRGRDLATHLTAPLRGLVEADESLSLNKVEGLIRHLAHKAKEETENGFRSEAAYEDLGDQLECLWVVARESAQDGVTSLNRIHAQVNALLHGEAGGIELSSVHRAKGDEAQRVIVLRPHLMPMQSGNSQEEQNIIYVAITRAKHQLLFAHQAGKAIPDWLVEAEAREDRPPRVPTDLPAAPETFVEPEDFVETAFALYYDGKPQQATHVLIQTVLSRLQR